MVQPVNVMITSGGRPEGVQGIGDCSVRALAQYLDVPYFEAEALLVAHTDYTPRRGVTNLMLYSLLGELGLKRTNARVRLTGKDAQSKLPHKCLLIFRRHIAAYEDGVIYDCFNPLMEAGCKQIRAYYAEGA